MTYAQKSFLRYFGQNWAKIQKKFFWYFFLYKRIKKTNKNFKNFAEKILIEKVFFS